MSTEDLQVQLFQYLKNRMPPQASLVDEVAAALDISTDSAYRRIRGEKPITLEEVYALCTRYNFSLDTLLNLKTDTISFQGKYIDSADFRFDTYLASVAQQMKYMASFEGATMYYLCKDVPVFRYWQFKELAAFKYFFWHKTIWQSPAFAAAKVALSNYPDEIFALSKKSAEIYNQINSYEIWNFESLNGTLRQVEFYHDTQMFQNDTDLLAVYESLEKLFTHLESQAELGYKFDNADPERKRLGNFHMYFNEVIIGDNSILGVLGETKIAFVNHTGVNYMVTRDTGFCENLFNYYQNLMRKSTLISTVSERERSKFFKVLRNRIDARKQNLKVSA